jgi:ATP-dependent Clp protease adapter protein ClpS
VSADQTISPYGRGTCPVCGRDVALRKDGTVRQHGAKNGWPPQNCSGWGMAPEEKP